MKNYIIIAALLAGVVATQPVRSQVSVNVNIGVQPLWGPVGYDYVEYYYLPDYGVYYYVPTAQFVFFDGSRWIFAAALPPRFGVINYYTCYKVVINQPKAYMYYDTHKVKYAGYKGQGAKQVVIRDSRDPKYYIVKGHPNHGQVKKEAGKPAAAPKPAQGSYKSAPRPAPSSGSHKAAPAPAPRAHPGGHGGGSHKGGGQGRGGGKPK